MNNQINHFQTLHPEEEITKTTYGSSEGKFDSHFQSDIFWKVSFRHWLKNPHIEFSDMFLISEETNNFDKEDDECQYSSRENVSSYSSNIQGHNTLSQNTSMETGKNLLWLKS